MNDPSHYQVRPDNRDGFATQLDTWAEEHADCLVCDGLRYRKMAEAVSQPLGKPLADVLFHDAVAHAFFEVGRQAERDYLNTSRYPSHQISP